MFVVRYGCLVGVGSATGCFRGIGFTIGSFGSEFIPRR